MQNLISLVLISKNNRKRPKKAKTKSLEKRIYVSSEGKSKDLPITTDELETE